MKNIKPVFIILLLLGFAFFSAFKYFSALKEKNSLLATVEKLNIEIAALGSEKQKLIQSLQQEKQLKDQTVLENSALQESLKASAGQLAQIEEQSAQAQDKLVALESYLSLLKVESSALKNRVAELTSKNEEYNACLNSLPELKKAIRELKMRLSKTQIQRRTGAKNNVEGNNGFVVRNGKSTLPAQVKIEVKPAPAKE